MRLRGRDAKRNEGTIRREGQGVNSYGWRFRVCGGECGTGVIARGVGAPVCGTRGVHVFSAGGAEVVAAELEVKAATRQPKLARRARDVAVVLAQRLGDHAPLKLGHRVGER